MEFFQLSESLTFLNLEKSRFISAKRIKSIGPENVFKKTKRHLTKTFTAYRRKSCRTLRKPAQIQLLFQWPGPTCGRRKQISPKKVP